MIDRTKLKKRIQAGMCSGKADMEDAIRKNQQLEDYSGQTFAPPTLE